MQVYIKKISFSPVRYLVYQTGVDWVDPEKSTSKIYIGSATYQVFFKGKITIQVPGFEEDFTKPIDVSEVIKSEVQLQEIAKTEKQNLNLEMYGFLANQETSPAKLAEWLRLRNIPEPERKKCLQDATQQKFISLERYTEVVVAKKYQNAKEPWWLVAKSLTFELEHYRYLLSKDSLDNFSLVSEFVEAHAFDDLDMLQKNYRLPSLRPTNGKITKQLLAKGFSYRVVEKYLTYLDSQSQEQ